MINVLGGNFSQNRSVGSSFSVGSLWAIARSFVSPSTLSGKRSIANNTPFFRSTRRISLSTFLFLFYFFDYLAH